MWNLKLKIIEREMKTMVGPYKKNGKNKNTEEGIRIKI
jgi:hypothetical protein